MKIETERLIITPCTEEMISVLKEQNYDNGPQVWNHIEKLKEDPAILYWGPWLAVLKSDGTIIGDLGFKEKPDEKGAVEIGYGLLEAYWNKGYATEAVDALIGWAWKQENVRRIKAETLPGNAGSIRVLEKLGMKEVVRSEVLIYWEINKG
ncbi:GNAT family N-acetyltransferase [Planococcus sp. CAU13]|uniref:GNAT family N-acetyltransferase n=1 Tax=Planococcus sp. CAU13 TaxID=1541197 RepID=UPI00052FFD8D|nr:GNAT family N-acetyltransferase [Planococcus sp. CAU13]